MSKNAPPPQRIDTLQRLKDHYSKRIDDSCEQMLESFHGMLRAAHVSTIYQHNYICTNMHLVYLMMSQ